MTNSSRIRYAKDPLSALTHFVGLLLAVAGLITLCLLSRHDVAKLAVMSTCLLYTSDAADE